MATSSPSTDNAFILAPLAAPGAVWFGGALFFIVQFGREGFAVRMFWHSLLCFDLLLGSFLFSLPLLLVVRKLIVVRSISNRVFVPIVLCLGNFVTISLLLNIGHTSPNQSGVLSGIAFLTFGLALNALVFLRLNSKPNTAVEGDVS